MSSIMPSARGHDLSSTTFWVSGKQHTKLMKTTSKVFMTFSHIILKIMHVNTTFLT